MFICPKKIMMALLFMLLAAPVAFQAVRGILGGWIATAEGMPKVGGLAVHALVFMLLSTLIWRYLPFGASNFEGMGDEEFIYKKMRQSKKKGGFFKAAKRMVENFEDDPDEYEEHDGEEYEDDMSEEYEEHDGEDFRLSEEQRQAKRQARASRRAARRSAREAKRARARAARAARRAAMANAVA
jgi:hypothetical protein